ncbi:hypothetical protein IJJ27_03220 [bacterium]|nr:hypothetical protein [bacterium]
MEKKYTPFLIVGIIIALMFAILVFAKLKRTASVSVENYNEVSPSADLALDLDGHDFYLFSREGCPHCAQVQSFREQHSSELSGLDVLLLKLDTDDLRSRELFSQTLTQDAELCGLDTKTLGVPFLFDNRPAIPDKERCLVGDTPIINHLSQVAGIAP